MKPRLCPANRDEWRAWLERHHASDEEVWLVYYKQHTGKTGISYRESVEEAICFGWIDGLKRRIDEQRYAHRFTPRRKGSKWSPLNIRLAGKMQEQGKMADAGQAAFDQRKPYDESFLKAREVNEVALPREAERVLKANRQAWQNYTAMAPGYRRQYALWLAGAVKPETRAKRLEEAERLLEMNLKLGMR